ncbi:MAG TPA: hypothetical protein VGK57_11550 [Candidatus Binatia bacterium]
MSFRVERPHGCLPKKLLFSRRSGGGFGDSAFATWVYAQARQKGLCQEWNFH